MNSSFSPCRPLPLSPMAIAIGLICLAMRADGGDDTSTTPSQEGTPTQSAAAELPKPEVKPPSFSWDLSPYEVSIWLHADRQVDFADFDSAAWRDQMAQKSEAELGPGCAVRASLMPESLRRKLRGSLASVSLPEIAAALVRPIADKILLVGCFDTAEGPRLEIRELDTRTWNLGPLASSELAHRFLLADEISAGVSAAFRPLARVERADDKNGATILPRAGGLLITGKSRAEVRPGDIFRVSVRRADRHGLARPQDVSPIAWTYLTAGEANGRFLKSSVVTALRQPLSGRFSSRVEKLALVVRPQSAESTLTLRGRQAPHPPLTGYEVFDLQPGTEPQPIGVSDGEGRIVIPARETGIYRLHIRHGREVLARLPVVPGVDRELVAFLADDGPRLDAEGFASGLQETLIDTVARRQVAFARIERLLARGDFSAADREMEFLRLLPTRAQLAAQLSSQQAKFTSPDARVQGKINKLFTDTRQLLEKYLDPQEIEAQAGKIARARRGETGAPVPAPVNPLAEPMPNQGVPPTPMPNLPAVVPMPVSPPVVPMAVPPPQR